MNLLKYAFYGIISRTTCIRLRYISTLKCKWLLEPDEERPATMTYIFCIIMMHYLIYQDLEDTMRILNK